MFSFLSFRNSLNRKPSKPLTALAAIGLSLLLQLAAPTNLLNEEQTSQIPSNGSSGAVTCLLSLENSKGVKFLRGDVEGWSFNLSLPKEWIDSADGSKELSAQSSNIVLKSSSSPTMKLTFGNTLERSIEGRCQKGEIQISRFPDGISNVTVFPETLIYTETRFFQQISTDGLIHKIAKVASRVIVGIQFSALLFGFLYLFWFAGLSIFPKFRDEAKIIVGALSTFLFVGGFHYFFKLKIVLIIMTLLLLIKTAAEVKKSNIRLLQLRKYEWVDTNLIVFILFLGQFVSSTDFRTIGLLQTDTYNYRAQVELFRDIRLLDLTGPSEGFGVRSIDYSNRTFIQLISNTDVAWSILMWGCIWLSLVFFAGRLMCQAKASRLSRYIWTLSIPGLLGLWMEGYLSRFSVAAATVVAILILQGFRPNEKENVVLVMLLASYSFAIIPAFLPLILVLPFWYFYQKRILQAFKIGMLIALLAAPSSLWMRNIQVAFDFANDGILDGIGRNIVVPHWNQFSFVAQLFGFVSWHGGGVRSPVLKEQMAQLGSLDQQVVSFLPTLTILSIVVVLLIIVNNIKAAKLDPDRKSVV